MRDMPSGLCHRMRLSSSGTTDAVWHAPQFQTLMIVMIVAHFCSLHRVPFEAEKEVDLISSCASHFLEIPLALERSI